MRVAATLPALVLAVAPLQAADHERFSDALTQGEAHVNLRYRLEFVDQDAITESAEASTLRVRLNYATGNWRHWSGFIEFDQHIDAGLDNFNSGAGTSSPDRARYPVVADPNGSDLNLLYFRYAPGERWETRIGRQRIQLDDRRFVGGVEWRQNEQTYDSLSFQVKPDASTRLYYAYVANVNRIFGSGVAAGDHQHSTHLFNVRRSLNDAWGVTGYYYAIDNDDVAALSSTTLGVRVNGTLPVGANNLGLLAELARQSDAGDSPFSYDADYYRLQATWSFDNNLSAAVGIESLGGDNGRGFQTPLATLHAFNGWADQFLATPADGLVDRYLRLAGAAGKWKLQLVYHDFETVEADRGLGSEIDASAARPLNDHLGLLLKLARFDASDPAFTDTTKVWLMLTAAF